MQRIVRSFRLTLLFAAAVGAYSYHLSYQALGPSEAYSALAAAQPTVAAVVHNAMEFDPGKPVLYHLLLHWFCGWFGTSETALRAFSLTFGVATVALVFAYGRELFGPQVGLAAAAIWAFNPFAVVIARWARMYSMFVAFTLAHLLAMAKLRQSATMARTVVAGLLGAAMLYSHLAAVFIIGADLIVAVREFRRHRPSVSWPPVAIALLLFVPFIPIAAEQTSALLFGHWLDWIGVHHASTATRVFAAGLAAAAILWLSLGAPQAGEASELVWRCSVYAAVPLLALSAGSIVIRPMFAVRYAAPSFAVGAVILAWVLDQKGPHIRNDIAFAITALFVMLLPLSYAAQAQPWRQIAMRVAAGGNPRETIFFESGFFSPERVIDQEEGGGFPRGFFLVPFKYYFRQQNPNGAVPGENPAQARQLIENAVRRAGGAWLISGKTSANALAELPSGASFEMDFEQDFSRVLLLHVRLVNHNPQRQPALSCREASIIQPEPTKSFSHTVIHSVL
jgi:Dolichyl-phosphate-mannose-protein mannosyltransferase